MPMVPATVQLTEFPRAIPDCPGAAACTGGTTSALALEITTNGTPADLRHYLWHDETHFFDYIVVTNYWRAQFMAAWALPGGPDEWWRTIPHTGGGSAGEWFAEAGALCDKYGLNIGRLASVLPEASDWAVYSFPGWSNMTSLERSCQIIAAAGQAYGLPLPEQRSYRSAFVARQASR